SEPSAPADLASHADEAPCDANGGELPRRTRRDRVLVAWAWLVTARPLLTLVACVALGAASAWLTMSRLEFRSDRSELVNPELPWQKRFLEMRRSFPTWDEPAIVVVDRGLTPESQAAGERFIAELAARLQADARFPRVMSGFLLDEAPPGLIFTRPLEEIESIATALGQTAPVVASP